MIHVVSIVHCQENGERRENVIYLLPKCGSDNAIIENTVVHHWAWSPCHRYVLRD